jgi:N-acetylmuramoyl-L-alanine amidase
MNLHRAAGAFAGLLIVSSALSIAWGESAGGAQKKQAVCDHVGFHTVVDVGHTVNGGARSARGIPEYDYNLRQATEITQALTERGFAKTTLLITEEKTRKGLFQRSERANNLNADLFLSIHHDSVPDKFIEKWEFESEPYGFSDRFKGHSIFISNDNADRGGSLQFGHLLGLAMKARGLQYTPHYTEPFMGNRRRVLVDAAAGVYRYDQLIVLRTTRMPAVLLEAGSIINRDEELALGYPERRALVTQAVVDAVDGFCAQRSRQSETVSAARRAKPKAQKP